MDNQKTYSVSSHCRSCKSDNVEQLYKMHDIPVAGIYYDSIDEPLDINAPMTLSMCRSCGLMQLSETIDPCIYDDYNFAGSTMPTYAQHLKRTAEMLVNRMGIREKEVFEVGASDGLLLKYLSEMGNNKVSGIEPSMKLCRVAETFGINVTQGYFNKNFIDKNDHKYDCIIIRHVLEHIDDLNDMVFSLAGVLKTNGILLIEVPDAEEILRKRLYSNIFHEHLNYFSKASLNNLLSRYGLRNIHTEKVDIHGGSFLSVYSFGKLEEAVSFYNSHDLIPMMEFSKDIEMYYAQLGSKIKSMQSLGKKVLGYGASHRTFVILGNAGLKKENIPIIFDINPFLHHRYMNGFHSLVSPVEKIAYYKPDVVVVFASSYEQEIVNELRGKYNYDKEILSIRSEVIMHENM